MSDRRSNSTPTHTPTDRTRPDKKQKTNRTRQESRSMISTSPRIRQPGCYWPWRVPPSFLDRCQESRFVCLAEGGSTILYYLKDPLSYPIQDPVSGIHGWGSAGVWPVTRMETESGLDKEPDYGVITGFFPGLPLLIPFTGRGIYRWA